MDAMNGACSTRGEKRNAYTFLSEIGQEIHHMENMKLDRRRYENGSEGKECEDVYWIKLTYTVEK
jgi:hypothetical protein